MKPIIKKGDKYLCIKDYINYEDEICFEQENVYESLKDGTLPSKIDVFHKMNDEEDFFEHFRQVEGNIDTISVTNTKDNINPDHYKQGNVECIDALESATVNKSGIEAVCTANVIKYLWRYESKNGIEDVKKGLWYMQKLIKHLEDKNEK
jgi:hypothetical protein